MDSPRGGLLLAWLYMLVSVSQLLPLSTQNSSTAGQNPLSEELREVTSEIGTIMDTVPRLKDKLRQLAARMNAQEDVKSQGDAIKAQAQGIHEQGEAIKVQGHEIKVQGQAVQKIVDDLKIHGTGLKELVEVIEDLGTSFRDLRKGIVNQLEDQDRKIEWSITDGSLAPSNTSWVEANLRAVLDHEKKQERQLEELRQEMNDLTVLIKRSDGAGCSEADRSGVYTVVRYGLKMKAYCNVDQTGKWTVIQRRMDGSINFTRNWAGYRQGFGDVAGEHWLGNDNIHALTAAGLTKLRVDVEDWEENVTHTVYYNRFRVAGAEDMYTLTVSGFTGSTPPGDSFTLQSGMKFSTYDQDNDVWGNNCGLAYRGGWWYKSCFFSNLNGEYNTTTANKGIIWNTWKGWNYSLKKTTMMISNGFND